MSRSGPDGRHVETGLGAVHHGRSVDLGEALMLRAPREGHYELGWTLYAKNGRRHCTGTLELVMPTAPERPAFTRLRGIESFPDLPFDDGEVVREARTDDPPTRPPDRPNGGSALDLLLEGRAYGEWQALGLADGEDDAAEPEAQLQAILTGARRGVVSNRAPAPPSTSPARSG